MNTRSILFRTLFILGAAASLLQAQSAYKVVEVRNGARIIGTVRYTGGDVKMLATMERTKDEAICGRSKTSGRLIFGGKMGVKNAVISLEGIDHGKKETRSMRPVLDQKGCEYEPHIMIAPLGSQLEIVNSDPILHNVHAYAASPGKKTLFNIAQPIKGQRTSIRQMQMNSKGIVTAVCDAGHPWMTATIIVAEHPYYAVTDDEGQFVLEDIPPGSYRLIMWHEGVRVTNVEYEHDKPKKYSFEEPYRISKSVDVKEGETRRVDFDFTVSAMPK